MATNGDNVPMASLPADEFDLGDLDLGDLTVTSMRDTVALPESGASGIGVPRSSCSCSCCIYPD